MILEFQDVSVAVRGRTLLSEVSFGVSQGSSAVVMGRSGSGKTTLLSCALGMVRPDQGGVMIAGDEIASASAVGAARIRRHSIGMVFQHGELLPELTPIENVEVAALLAGLPANRAHAAALEALQAVGVPEDSGATLSLSGGERQRVAVARAIVHKPPLILADEPTGSLDEETRDVVAELLFSLPHSSGCGLVVVTHDPAVAVRGDHMYHLEEGQLVITDGAVA